MEGINKMESSSDLYGGEPIFAHFPLIEILVSRENPEAACERTASQWPLAVSGHQDCIYLVFYFVHEGRNVMVTVLLVGEDEFLKQL